MTLSTPAIADIVVSRKQMSNIFGGSIMRMCVRTAGRDFIFPALNMNPFLPHAPGAPGLLFRSNDALPWKGDVQTVFVGLRQGEYRYCGQYRLRRADVLSAEEFSALSSKVSTPSHIRQVAIMLTFCIGEGEVGRRSREETQVQGYSGAHSDTT